VFGCCLHDRDVTIEIDAVVVMPDHVHMIFMPLINQSAREVYSLAQIMDAIKGASAHKVNKFLGRCGKVWQTESFDHVLRSSESLGEKIEYVLNNPVRRGLVENWWEYKWIGYREVDHRFRPEPKVEL
jgi:REP element-mobilizing transposase RayT